MGKAVLARIEALSETLPGIRNIAILRFINLLLLLDEREKEELLSG